MDLERNLETAMHDLERLAKEAEKYARQRVDLEAKMTVVNQEIANIRSYAKQKLDAFTGVTNTPKNGVEPAPDSSKGD